MRRTISTAVAVVALAAFAPPALAQDEEPAPRPCPPVPGCVEQTFDTAQWAVETTADAPATAIAAARDVWETTHPRITEAIETTGEALDRPEETLWPIVFGYPYWGCDYEFQHCGP